MPPRFWSTFNYFLLAAFLLLVITSVINPFMISIKKYMAYSELAKKGTYENATMRSVQNHGPIFGLFGYCHESVTYDVPNNGKILQGSDKLNCRYVNTLLIGNTIPIYYDKQQPQKNISAFTLASSKKDAINNITRGLVTVALIAVGYLVILIFQLIERFVVYSHKSDGNKKPPAKTN